MPKMTSNEKINLTVVIGVIFIATAAMIVVLTGKNLTEATIGALLALPGQVAAGLIGFLARDSKRFNQDPPPTEEQP